MTRPLSPKFEQRLRWMETESRFAHACPDLDQEFPLRFGRAQIKLRLDEPLRASLAAEAKANERSLNAEIVHRLKTSLQTRKSDGKDAQG